MNYLLLLLLLLLLFVPTNAHIYTLKY